MILRAPIRNFSKTRHHARTRLHAHITQNEQTPCCPCSLCLSRQPPDVIQRYARLPWSEINGASNDTQRSEQNMVFPLEFGSTPSATWWWPSSNDDVCSLRLSRQPLVVIAISMSTIIRIERDIEWYAEIWTEHCSSPVIWLNVVGDVAIAIRHNNRRIQQSKSYRCR